MHADFRIPLSLVRPYQSELLGNHRVLSVLGEERQRDMKFERDHVGVIRSALCVVALRTPIGTLLRACEVNFRLRFREFREYRSQRGVLRHRREEQLR